VADKLVRGAQVPLLVVRPPARRASREGKKSGSASLRMHSDGAVFVV
jgi:hypothetical protein